MLSPPQSSVSTPGIVARAAVRRIGAKLCKAQSKRRLAPHVAITTSTRTSPAGVSKTTTSPLGTERREVMPRSLQRPDIDLGIALRARVTRPRNYPWRSNDRATTDLPRFRLDLACSTSIRHTGLSAARPSPPRTPAPDETPDTAAALR